ncbi:hypothetical protein BDV59DRAFT_147954 [Aspergillus ambiguus]|uniref:uncharacterized protein n=1 Tax=Aspergillus ambiguus TaxID=176160 RepID=UPI003CCD855D
MRLIQSLAILTTMVGLATSQTNATISPSSVDSSTRSYWCQQQTSTCPLLCLQMPGASSNPSANTCDSKTLAYTCTCSNGLSPNSSEYSQTIPYFICTEQNNQCVASCSAGDSSCQSACRSDHPCGAQNPQRYNTTSTSTGVPAATTSLAPFTGTAEKGAAVQQLADMGQVYGLAVVVGAFLAGFRVLL